MQTRGNQSKVYRIEIMQLGKCRDEERKVKYTEQKSCRCQYAGAGKGK